MEKKDGPLSILDLFCGTKSVSDSFKDIGFEALTLDFDPQFDPDVCGDIFDWDHVGTCGPGQFDVVWSSPPCQGFSVAQIGKNWKKLPVWGGRYNLFPKTEKAEMAQAIVIRTIEIIKYLKPRYWFIENPRGALRKQPFMREFDGMRKTVTYCQYGDFRMKPTDIWGVFPESFPIRCCKNGDPCHERAPRGARTGTQGIKGAIERGRLPKGFCDLLAREIEKEIKNKGESWDKNIGFQ